MNAQLAIKRRIGVGLLAVCATLLSSGCATGQHAATADEVPAIDGASGVIGDIQLHEVAIKSPTGATAYSAGDSAELQVIIVNTGHENDRLITVSTPVASDFRVFASAAAASAAISPSASASASVSVSASASASPSGGASASGRASTSGHASASGSASAASSAAPAPSPVSLVVAAGRTLSLGAVGTDAVVLLRLTKTLFPGPSVSITFTFAKAGAVTIAVPVQLSANSSSLGITIGPQSSSAAG